MAYLSFHDMQRLKILSSNCGKIINQDDNAVRSQLYQIRNELNQLVTDITILNQTINDINIRINAMDNKLLKLESINL